MRLVLPFEKSVKFDTTIKEICSISLEHEITKNEDEILGNFILDGTYKEHELSINETPFNFVLPFSVDLDKKVNVETIDFTIDNFMYDINDDNLDIKIDYIINADEIQEIDENREEDIDLTFFMDSDDIPEEVVEIHDEELREDDSMKQVDNTFLEDDFVCYHLHIVKENDTKESLAKLYNCDVSEIRCLNDEIKKDDHVIVPIRNV